jgi:alpha-glucoside transport system permease protein
MSQLPQSAERTPAAPRGAAPAVAAEPPGFFARLVTGLTTGIGRILVAILIPLITFYVLYQGFLFLRDADVPKWLQAGVAILWGVGGVLILYFVFNWLVESLPEGWTRRLQPFVFVGPAVAILGWYLAFPTLRTFYLSLFDRSSTNFVGLENYIAIFTQRQMLQAFINNILWIVVGATLTVVLGLVVAVLADRSSFERFAKALVFMPMAISMVGAGIIWQFMYIYRDPGTEQIGLLNAVVQGLGGEPRAWTQTSWPWNNLFLIAIVVWLQAGYAMTLFSAAIKGIPGEIMEASRVDGATEWQVFTRIMLPSIMPTIITVSTTVVIFTLKIFDVVMVMTGGQYGTQVIATEFYRNYFAFRNFGYGSAVAIVLLLAVIPVMVYNLRQFREREAF